MNNISEDTAAVAAKETLPAVAGEPKMGPFVEDITGQKFGRLTAIRFAYKMPKGHAVWEFKCECGKYRRSLASKVKRGHVKSCGCLLKEVRIERKGTTDGMRHDAIWRLYKGIIARCTNPKRASFKNYGGRGIKMCERWRLSFKDFVSDLGPRPSSDYSVDRIDNDGDYSPENCRWATAKEQMNNRRVSRIIEHNGKIMSLTSWAEHANITPTALSYRLKNNWPMEEALNKRGKRKKASPQREASEDSLTG